jgi:hypothetical protein
MLKSPLELGAAPGPTMLTTGLQATAPPVLVKVVQPVSPFMKQAFGQEVGVGVGVIVGVLVTVGVLVAVEVKVDVGELVGV